MDARQTDLRTLLERRDALKAKVTRLQANLQNQYGKARKQTAQAMRQLQSELADLNELMRQYHTEGPPSETKKLPFPLLLEVARAADAYLFSDDDSEDDDEAAGDALERALAKLDKTDPDWRSR